MPKIGVIVGSTRTGSWNRRIAQDLASQLPDGFDVVDIAIDNLPFYSSEWDTPETLPESVATLRATANSCDGFIIASPEFNRSIPGVLKNALDILSRPYGATTFAGKPTLVATATPGAMGGFGANRDLRTVLAFLDAQIISQPEIYVSFVHKLYDGDTLNPETSAFFHTAAEKFVAAFHLVAK
ncbi:NADPH-dependent FMN reductase [Arcanobacterium buesumense]|uniref:NAD(P)H-dependent oxidoreductase n=1 Tax=Arcanobacterium buesumense TaxID=2722751 RepID=A0A6H2EMS7_9ACTO|nr:NAD(P)H-dependent oxidoreductase [Arcanobacterium buesumense]QJC22376.1 NAD(P)H-dependent oxidoreductase [Arcanobacterium buesumense]